MKRISRNFSIQAADINGDNILRILSVDKISKTIRIPVNVIKIFIRPS